MNHPPHGYRYHNPNSKDTQIIYTSETQPQVALGVLAVEARSLGWKPPERYTHITPWYYEDVKRVPMSGRAGRMYHD